MPVSLGCVTVSPNCLDTDDVCMDVFNSLYKSSKKFRLSLEAGDGAWGDMMVKHAKRIIDRHLKRGTILVWITLGTFSQVTDNIFIKMSPIQLEVAYRRFIQREMCKVIAGELIIKEIAQGYPVNSIADCIAERINIAGSVTVSFSEYVKRYRAMVKFHKTLPNTRFLTPRQILAEFS